MTENRTDSFIPHRARLRALAYRMTGSVSEADDIVQEAFVRWQQDQPDEMRSAGAWLTTIVTRLCLNHLKSARVRRVVYFGPWLPEPMIAEANPLQAASGAENSRLADSLSIALLVVLESLTPTERAVFVLREVFDYEFAEVAAIVAKSEVNCRRILARARASVAERRPRFDVASPQRDRVFDEFTRAAGTGDMAGLLALLADDVAFVSDGGGRARALPVPIVGAKPVARLVAGVVRRLVPAHRTFQRVTVNGLPGILGCEHGKVVQVLALGIGTGRVSCIYIVTNPSKLRHLQRSADGAAAPIEYPS